MTKLTASIEELVVKRKTEEEMAASEDAEIAKMQRMVEENIAEVVRTTRPEDKELLAKMRKLISTNEKIKKQESEFRLACKEELGVLEARNGSARSRLKEVTALDAGSEEGAKLRQELRDRRLELAARARLVMDLERKVGIGGFSGLQPCTD